MTTLSGPVGVRNGTVQVANARGDQGKVIGLLWKIPPADGGQSGLSTAPAPGRDKVCEPRLAGAILAFQSFWVQRSVLPMADGVVDKAGQTLRKLDSLAARPPPKPAPKPGPQPVPPQPLPGFTDLKVLRFIQTMPDLAGSFEIQSIEPASVMPYLFRPLPKGAALQKGKARGTIFEFLFKIEKNGVIFWVGASVPLGTVDFSRVYIFFHPDTMTQRDDVSYANFGGRWPTVKRYVPMLGLQMAQAKSLPMPVLVPFMTNASRKNAATSNLFADRGVETLNDIVTAIRMTMGLTGQRPPLQHVGVASYSSGVNHMFTFAQNLGPSGLIREQIDFDGAFIIDAHKSAANIFGAVNWMVTQTPPPGGPRPGWLHVDSVAFRNVTGTFLDTHGKIGNMMFQAMMVLSAIR